MSILLAPSHNGDNSKTNDLVYIEHPDQLMSHPELIEKLPKEYLLKLSPYQLEQFWECLSNKLKEDSDLQERRPCYEHYNRPEDEIHIDGPAPPKYRCYVCQANKKVYDT
ncbi:unnamed protein product [Acanthoscelides obtectus]|uniref:Uncharacterized protein n=1 Tax=Acanthoscelides obtectus TaxID=200917 RepID=A0A9P0P051_ACAOB|nr:unnamed protein product [Acanthoscelides obtectus]CAK1666006.1 hypothetical protein AOBTE_LOCUS25108 [Acanthoscelides obtectus]